MSGMFSFFKRKPANDEHHEQNGSSGRPELQRSPDKRKAIEVGQAWGIEEELWDRNWGNLSGGEAQRIALATAVGLGQAEILLLDGTLSQTTVGCRSQLTSMQNRRPRWMLARVKV